MSQPQPSTNESIEYVAVYNRASLEPNDPEPVKKFFEDQGTYSDHADQNGTVAEILVYRRKPFSAEAIFKGKHPDGTEYKPKKLHKWYARQEQALNAMITELRKQ